MTIKLAQLFLEAQTDTNEVPRETMPQIPAAKHNEFQEFLKSKGVNSILCKVKSEQLKPFQTEVDKDKIRRLAKTSGVDEKAVIVSNDGYVIDGLHRMIANRLMRKPTYALVCNVPVDKLLELGHEFDGSFTKSIEEHIVKSGTKYCLKSKKSGKNLGCYPSKAGARKREGQVEYFKHRG